jgi:hypothetical protein
MRPFVMPGLLVPVVLAGIACRTADPADSSPPQARRLRADVEWLAADEREGRRAGTSAAMEAGEWIARRLSELGLEPAGESGYLQHFEVPLPPRDGGSSSVSVGDRSWSAPEVVPLYCSEGGSASGPIVFAGYGLVDEERGWNEYTGGADIQGSIVLIVRGAPTGSDSDWGGRASIFHKVMTAKRSGASAVLLAQHPSGTEPMLPFSTGRSGLAGIPALSLSARAAEDLLGRSFRALVEERDRAAASAMAPPGPIAINQQVEATADIERAKGQAANVLALLRGVGGGPAVVVGAHYDHLGLGGTGSLANDVVGEVHNGADDNASGTACVLELARVLSRGPAPRGDVLFALWSGEELGLLGSEHWARNPTIDLEQVSANLNLDMVGRVENGKLQILGAGSSGPFEQMLDELGERHRLDLQVSLSGQGIGGSDHQTFLKREIPALHLFSGVHADYHKPSDDAVRFEAEGARRVVELCIDLVGNIQAQEQLAYVQPVRDPAQRTSGASGLRVWFGTVPEYASDEKGLLLAGTSPGSPAERAGLLQGDLIVQIGDLPIASIYDFMYALEIHKPGDVVHTRYVRDGRVEEVPVTLATRELE